MCIREVPRKIQRREGHQREGEDSTQARTITHSGKKKKATVEDAWEEPKSYSGHRNHLKLAQNHTKTETSSLENNLGREIFSTSSNNSREKKGEAPASLMPKGSLGGVNM